MAHIKSLYYVGTRVHICLDFMRASIYLSDNIVEIKISLLTLIMISISGSLPIAEASGFIREYSHFT
jgi:hypothetical protein